MLAKICAGIVVGWLLLGAGLDAGSPMLVVSVVTATAYQTDGPQATRVMQQMDHRRRMDEQEREEARAAVAAAESGAIEQDLSSANVDYAVVGILGVTGAVLFAACRGKRCWPRRKHGSARRRVGTQIKPRI